MTQGKEIAVKKKNNYYVGYEYNSSTKHIYLDKPVKIPVKDIKSLGVIIYYGKQIDKKNRLYFR